METETAPKIRRPRKIRITPVMEKVLSQLKRLGPQSTLQLAVDLKVSHYDMWRWMKILEKVGKVQVSGKSMNGFAGRPASVWRLTPENP